MNEQIEKLEHGLMICEATGTKLVHIEKADAEKIIGLLKDQESVIEALKSDLAETLQVLSEKPEIVRCKDCKHRPTTTHGNMFLVFPDNICPCQVDDDWYSWWPKDDWFCADGERKD